MEIMDSFKELKIEILQRFPAIRKQPMKVRIKAWIYGKLSDVSVTRIKRAREANTQSAILIEVEGKKYFKAWGRLQ